MAHRSRRPSLRQVGSKAWRPELVEITDLRRRQEAHAVDWLLTRALCLPTSDRELIEAVYREGKSAAEIARLGSQPVYVVRSRIKQVLGRLCTDKLPFVIERSPSWSPTRQRVARQCVVHGDPMRVAAKRLGISLHTVRRHMYAIDELYQAAMAELSEPKKSWA